MRYEASRTNRSIGQAARVEPVNRSIAVSRYG